MLQLSMKPTGWFHVGWSAEIPNGGVKPMKYFGQELVAFRTEAGELNVLDAHCRHLGAHLGYGGTVQGDCVTCPYHGWHWDGAGNNARVPYQDLPTRAKMRSWPVAERHGLIYLWHDPEGGPPRDGWTYPDVFADFEELPRTRPTSFPAIRTASSTNRTRVCIRSWCSRTPPTACTSCSRTARPSVLAWSGSPPRARPGGPRWASSHPVPRRWPCASTTTNLKLVRAAGKVALPSATPSITARTGCTYLTFRVADVAATRDVLIGLGGTALSDPSLEKVAAFVADPEGNLVELFRAPRQSPEAN